MKSNSNNWISRATRYRYSLPVLAELQRDKGCKFVTLFRRLEASDRAVRQALDYLMELGWVERNTGYGHPSRPEYILTPRALEIAAECLRVWSELQKWGQTEVALERWPLPILHALGDRRRRYGDLLSELPGLTPRALSTGLKRLAEAGLAARDILPGSPPQTDYRATPWGIALIGSSQSPA